MTPNKLVFFFLACLLMFTFSDDNLVAGDSDKVKLNLYYESLCPGCQEFIVDGLVKVFDSDLHTITDLTLVPFGNAKISDNLTVACQHGEEECKLNAIEACAIKTWPNPLILAYAKQTLSLKPKHKYVPWVTVNGKPLYEKVNDFVAQVCKAYKGKSALPKVCNSSALSKSRESNNVFKLQVSYADEAINY
ncbi:unnamed protein product [Arabis nemorensis]|uniref:Saposin A-type domain-containing protein n=1 Tax=Arabis nemorensis TaxID=586526 RepID=A0A565BID4_9BRAS|nr:unnamed protein product [Arabis nemorensis]